MKSVAPACPLLVILVWGLLAFGWQQPAYSWGDQGHRITGYIANANLSDATRDQLRTLLGTDNLALIANWMDEERESLNQRLPGSSRWHYENRLACDLEIDSAPPCPQDQCITRQIDRWTKVLQNRDESVAHRADAVRILVHLLGDLHQPLHLSDNYDRGGNDVLVRLSREKEPRRLHEVWDTRLVQLNLRRASAENYARALGKQFENRRSDWQTGTVEQWARETHALGRDAYQSFPGFACRTVNEPIDRVTVLTADYLDKARPIVDAQLARAGVRIAWVLNTVLDATHAANRAPINK